MAEDEDFEEIEGGMKSRVKKKKYVRDYEECNVRLDELAKPRKWYLLSTYQENLDKFDEERLEKLRAKIQEAFSLSPEDTEKYMEKFKRKIKTDIRKRELLKEKKKQKTIAKKKAYMLFRKFVKRGMMYACQHCPPPIVSPVVNCVSDAILKILAEIHNVPMPKRRNNDKISQFLMANADWLAIAICSIYYDVQIEQKREIEAQVQLEKQLETDKKKVMRQQEEVIKEDLPMQDEESAEAATITKTAKERDGIKEDKEEALDIKTAEEDTGKVEPAEEEQVNEKLAEEGIIEGEGPTVQDTLVEEQE